MSTIHIERRKKLSGFLRVHADVSLGKINTEVKIIEIVHGDHFRRQQYPVAGLFKIPLRNLIQIGVFGLLLPVILQRRKHKDQQ